ncbi:MAG TPA: uracil-DNA glycosylase family protein [Anaerolineae bacterium]|nr:uracil-DNA glycosylase family protein [Anaerolineae bacterium]
MSYRTDIVVAGRTFATLQDILPESGPMRMMIIGKTPAPVSVKAGHYLQGRQGRMFWNRLQDYGLLRVPPGKYEDEVLLDHGYGITDIVKRPYPFGVEPSGHEYRDGIARVKRLLLRLAPRVALFVYKKPLDRWLSLEAGWQVKSEYGFNRKWETSLGCKVFVFPMPGTPCNSDVARQAMRDLVEELRTLGQ